MQQQQYQQHFQQMQQQYAQQYQYYKAAGKERFEGFKSFANIADKSDKTFYGGDGSRRHPARTCEDLFKTHPNKETGDYWVDPNEGSNHDATLVFCDKKTFATCVYPKFNKVGEWEWEDMKKRREITNGWLKTSYNKLRSNMP